MIETWGYPREGTDWLRKRRLLVVAVLVVISWTIFLAAGWLIYAVISELAGMVFGAPSPLAEDSVLPASTLR